MPVETAEPEQLPSDLTAQTAAGDDGRVALNRLLIAGILLRIVVFFMGHAANVDDHIGVIRYLVEHGSMARSNDLQQSYHPPLYYVLMAPIFALSDGALWPLHLVSLVLSCLNLWLLRRLFDDPFILQLSPGKAFRVLAFGLTATLTQLIVTSSYISNDALTYLLGTVQFVALLRYVRTPSARGIAWLSLWVALGLLTKGTFLLAWVAIATVILRTECPRRGSAGATRMTATFVAVVLIIGGYKYAENYVRLGRPIVHNQEQHAVVPYALKMWIGPQSLYDFNLASLIRHPVVQPSRPRSYGMMMFATYWYSFLNEPSFRGNFSGYERVGSIMYAVAWVPTLLFLAGILVSAKAAWRWLRGETADILRDGQVAAVALLLANVVVVFAAGLKFDRWECFQSRLLMQSTAPMIVLFLAGAGMLSRWKTLRFVALGVGWATVGCALLYFYVEFAVARHLLPTDDSLVRQMYE